MPSPPPPHEVEAFTPRDGQPLIVAEAGSDHRGDPVRGRELIEAARESGADCIKFQHIYAHEILHPRAGMIEAGGREVPIFERLHAVETTPELMAELFAHARRIGIIPFATPFGIRSARELAALAAPAFKIASPELNHTSLLVEVASYARPMILSTGVAGLGDIEAAVALCGGSAPLHLLHCVTAYPAPEEDYNLEVLRSLRRILGVPVGLSDHTLDPVFVPMVAVALGAGIVEKHFTLARDGRGLDDAVSLEPKEFADLTRRTRELARQRRTKQQREAVPRRDAAGRAGVPPPRDVEPPLDVEPPRDVERLLEELAGEFGEKRVAAVRGDGVKRLAPSEIEAYGKSNRSLHALGDLPAGAVLTVENCAVLRSERGVRPGIAPRFLPHVIGSTLTRPVADGDGIRWEDLLSGRSV